MWSTGPRTGPSGSHRALAEPYELVVLDLLLPQLDGLHLLNDLRAQRPELPVLILSARSDLPTKLRSFELGANDYLSKPFSFDELVARVRVHLRRDRIAPTATTLRTGLVELDLARRRRGWPTAPPTSPTASSGCSTTSSRTPARS